MLFHPSSMQDHKILITVINCGVVVIVVGNGHSDTSSNPGPD